MFHDCPMVSIHHFPIFDQNTDGDHLRNEQNHGKNASCSGINCSLQRLPQVAVVTDLPMGDWRWLCCFIALLAQIFTIECYIWF